MGTFHLIKSARIFHSGVSDLGNLGNTISLNIFWKWTIKLTVTCDDSVAILAQLILSWPRDSSETFLLGKLIRHRFQSSVRYQNDDNNLALKLSQVTINFIVIVNLYLKVGTFHLIKSAGTFHSVSVSVQFISVSVYL